MFTGCGTALVTPFRRDLSLDEETLRRLVRRQIDAGIDFWAARAAIIPAKLSSWRSSCKPWALTASSP
jgi:hypothetical protein